MEHSITDEIDKPLEKALRHPKTCPHGNPIPTRCGGILEEKSKPLNSLDEGEKGIEVKITDEQSNLLHYLDTIGLVPGASIEILEKAPLDGPISIKVDESNRALSRMTASVIQVRRTT
jgi:DtxR family Mn-dependent transcriptional regulator